MCVCKVILSLLQIKQSVRLFSNPYFQLVTAAVLWSSSGVLIKSIDWSAAGVAGGRSLIAAIVLFPLLKGDWKIGSFKELIASILYALTLYTFVLAIKNTTAANAIVLQYSAPVYVAILSALFLGEKNSKLDWAFLLITISGMVLFFFDQLSPEGYLGNIYGIISGVFFGSLIVLLRSLRSGNPLRSVVYGNLIVLAISLPNFPIHIPDTKSIICLSLLGTFQIALSYYLFTEGIKKVRALDGTLISFIEPILNPIWVLIALGEKPGFWAIIGGSIVIGSLILKAISTKK